MSADGPETSRDDKAPEPDRPPRSLAEAPLALARIRPRLAAPREEWLAFYQRSAAWYAEIAETDRGHHHVALFLAGEERKHAMEIEAGAGGEGGGKDGDTGAADVDASS